jgi:hypothetical protein
MLRRKLFHRNHRHHCALYHLLAGAGVAGVAAFLSPGFVSLLTGFFSSFLSAAGTGASALVTAGVATGALAGSAANADTANTDAITSANDFILVSFEINAELYLHILITH